MACQITSYWFRLREIPLGDAGLKYSQRGNARGFARVFAAIDGRGWRRIWAIRGLSQSDEQLYNKNLADDCSEFYKELLP